MYKSFRIGCKGLSETPLHFIFRDKGVQWVDTDATLIMDGRDKVIHILD